MIEVAGRLPEASGQPAPRCLIASGVNISKGQNELGPDHPVPDYLAIRDALLPDVLDSQTITMVRHPLIRLVERGMNFQWAIAVAALMRTHRYQAILATGEDIGLPLAFLAKALRRRIPLLVICHNISGRRAAVLLGRAHVAPAVRKFLCLSRSQARILVERYGVEPGRIRIVFGQVDHRFFRPDHHAVCRPQICSAGMASRDYATLIAATRDLPIDVRIAVDSPWFQQRPNISHEDLPPRAEMRSYGTYRALQHLYAESLFVVVPLREVDFSAGYTVILEAMAMGKAVIASKTKQPDDFIIEGWNGLYVPPGDVDCLRERIRYLIDHPREAERLGRNGRRRVEEHFTLDHYLWRIQDSLQEVVEA